MTDAERREAARQFYQKWVNRGKEKQDDQSYWFDFLQNILGVKQVTDRIIFQKEIVKPDGKPGWIDAYIPETNVLIEQKSLGIDLSKPQQGHGGKTPYEQAKEYDNALPRSEKSKWIIVSNFAEIWIYDMDARVPEPVKVMLSELPNKYSLFEFLSDKKQQKITQEMEVSFKAGDFVGLIYDALIKQYHDPESERALKSLNMLCVRLVFCLYAEDAHIFGDSGHMFHDYLVQFPTKDMRKALIELFKVLDTPESERDPYDESDLSKFPYVNGGLFADEKIEIPNFTDEIRTILLEKASEGFDWSQISPTIFGAVFESTLNPETRRSGGMHYTSIEYIHKVIDPLFLDDLKAELKEIKETKVARTKKTKLEAFQKKLASLKWLDPACGSGNFLTETYISIRRLENEVLKSLNQDQIGMWFADDEDSKSPIKVSISQFYGIEINDFAVTVAKTALWIAESQMLKETEDILLMHLDFLPLKTNAYIHEGNALRVDWNNVIKANSLSYIMGNPPFVGKKEQSKLQKQEMIDVFGSDTKGIGNADYVSAWYKKSANYIQNTPIKCAFLSTNSIVQGEQVSIIWRKLTDLVQIFFAYTPFEWKSEAFKNAQVHCVIIGFCDKKIRLVNKKIIDDDSNVKEMNTINPYFLDAPTVFIDSRSEPICNVPEISYGSMPIDNGNLILKEQDVLDLLSENNENKKYIRRYMGGEELLKDKKRWCLWLVGISPKEIQKSKFIMNRISLTKAFREQSNRPQTIALSETPYLFGEIRQPQSKMLVIPKVSSKERRYIPIGFVSPEIIVNGSALIIPDASLYHFGIMISNVHNAWMRTVAGRMKSDYQYSGSIVYNNFLFPTPTDAQKAKIEQTAQGILNARALYPDNSLANLYHKDTMPIELQKAHEANDRAVMQAYGFDVKTTSEADCVAKLMKMYKELTE